MSKWRRLQRSLCVGCLEAAHRTPTDARRLRRRPRIQYELPGHAATAGAPGAVRSAGRLGSCKIYLFETTKAAPAFTVGGPRSSRKTYDQLRITAQFQMQRRSITVNKYRELCRRLVNECAHPEMTHARKLVLLKLADLIDDATGVHRLSGFHYAGGIRERFTRYCNSRRKYRQADRASYPRQRALVKRGWVVPPTATASALKR